MGIESQGTARKASNDGAEPWSLGSSQSVNVSSMVLQSVQSGEWSEYSFIFQGKDERNCTASDCDGRVVG